MKKKFKAFTLVELIVAIAVFGILMTGVIKMIEPLSSTTTNAAVLNNQRNVENAIVTYIGENIRYASNLAIIQGGTAEEAVQMFINMKPSDCTGMQIDYSDSSNKNKIRVIAFDCKNDYTYKNNKFRGRIISSTEGRSGSLDFSYSNLSSDGSKNQYLVFGDEYYAQGNYYLDARICNGALCLTVDSDYHYTPSSGKYSNTSTAPTKGTYELRCMTTKNKSFVFACVNSGDTVNNTLETSDPATIGRTGDPDDPSNPSNNVIYFVYTYGASQQSDADYVTNNGTKASGTPGKGDANCPSLDGSSSSSSNNNNNDNKNNNNDNDNDNTDNGNSGGISPGGDNGGSGESGGGSGESGESGSTSGGSSNISGDSSSVNIDTKVSNNISIDSSKWKTNGEEWGGKILLSSDSVQIIIFEKGDGKYHIQTYPDWQNITNGDVSTEEAIKALTDMGYGGIQLA